MLMITVQVGPANVDSSSVFALARAVEHDVCLSTDSAFLLLNIWREAPDVIRASISHPKSGCVAMIQGNDALQRLADAVRLRFTLP